MRPCRSGNSHITRRPPLVVAAAVGASLLTISPAALHAQFGPTSLRPDIGLGVWTVLTFGLVFLLLHRLVWPRILAAVEAREDSLRELREAAERDRAEAHAFREQAEREWAATRERIRSAIAEERSILDRMRETTLTEASRDAQELLARARRELMRAEALRVAAELPTPNAT